MIEITVEIAPQDKKWSTAMEMLIETIKKYANPVCRIARSA